MTGSVCKAQQYPHMGCIGADFQEFVSSFSDLGDWICKPVVWHQHFSITSEFGISVVADCHNWITSFSESFSVLVYAAAFTELVLPRDAYPALVIPSPSPECFGEPGIQGLGVPLPETAPYTSSDSNLPVASAD